MLGLRADARLATGDVPFYMLPYIEDTPIGTRALLPSRGVRVLDLGPIPSDRHRR
jgi:hypothetical protein